MREEARRRKGGKTNMEIHVCLLGHKTIACVYGILMGEATMIYLRNQKSKKGVAVKKH